MIANVSVHRRANAFAQALEEQVLEGAAAEEQVEDPAQAPGEARLLAVADGLGKLPRPEMATEVKTVQRAQLIAAMEAAFAEGAPSDGARVPEQREHKGAHRATKSMGRLRPRSRLSKGLAAGGLTVGVAAGAFSGVAAASSDALPGDSLYGLKRGMEDLRLGMTDDDSDRGQLLLDQASTRMMEARRLMERARLADLDHESLGAIRKALSGVRQDAGEGHRLLHAAYERDGSLGPIQALNSFTKSHRGTWSHLRDRLPAQLTDVRDEVSSVFDAIDKEVGPLRSLLPSTPDSKHHRRDTPASAGTGSGPGSDDRPAPSGSTSAHDKRSGGKHAPRPSASPSQEDGLLGGNTGGLLDPPSKGSSQSPHEGGHSSGKDSGGQPDVTLPPLIPGLLPGLGIDGEDLPK
ncbi:DUF5667 domain-containing protein [Streptomyces sp. NPDC058773]|uniref:DUF5667 domain-containing protein n=1 Tax=Streptomyces sp. NPDC058773 TaxID=3346632 RepID=UPI0036979419